MQSPFEPYTTAEGVRFDLPPGFKLRARAGGDVFTNDRAATLTVLTTGACGKPMTELCRAINPGEEKWTRRVTTDTCLETGAKGDKLVWRRWRIVDDVLYLVTLDYPALEKIAFETIVERVSASWKVPDKAPPGGFFCP